jgi:hypothetical protein
VLFGGIEGLGRDQVQAVTALGAPGPALRALLSPAGHGKTTTLAAAAQLALASGRDVIGLAATNQAVAELEGAGVPALTIARLRTEARTLRPGTVVILDEVSQVDTADAEIVTSVVTTTPGAALWCAGDAAQAQSVRAGGLAVEVERLGKAGEIPAPRLAHNRRQVDEAERAALATYRAGLVEASQGLRAGAGLEHEPGSASATKAAMADAVVADIHRLGPHAVVALCATHADAEELADRVRAQLAEQGALDGPVLQGPGWSSHRAYAQGDRVLLHAPFGIGADRLHNNTTATVVGVGPDGMAIRADDGRATILDRAFAAGVRPDGRPNLSHGWARTVEGAQGGTWRQVHLLANGALDRHTGYVGQSRGRQPTHTWNVRREPEADHGGRRVQAASASDEARVALERDEPQVFAAAEDPNVLDRQLRTERAEHEAVLAHRPPSVDHDLRRARAAAKEAAERQRGARVRLQRAEQSLNKARRLRSRLTRTGRDGKAWADYQEWTARQSVPLTQDRLAECESDVERLEAAQQRRVCFDRQESWREERVVEIDDRLEHHWANAVLSAVREGEPLAYGPDRLRKARATFEQELHKLQPDHGRERSRLARTHGGSSPVHQTGATVVGPSELSALVAELDEAIEAWAPDPPRRSPLATSVKDRPQERDGLSRLATPLGHDQDLGLGLGQ